MHAVAREGCSGFLALRQTPDGACSELAVLAQLLGVHKASLCLHSVADTSVHEETSQKLAFSAVPGAC
jgi:hypothetical protein